MVISVDTRGGGPSIALEDPESFNAFSVAATGPGERFADTVSAIGRYDGEHVFVRPDAVRELAGELAADAAWEENLQKMIGYAEQHGWIDADGAIRAHVERR
jgi:hypothetical protein